MLGCPFFCLKSTAIETGIQNLGLGLVLVFGSPSGRRGKLLLLFLELYCWPNGPYGGVLMMRLW